MSGGYGLPGCYPLSVRVPPGSLLCAQRHQPTRRDAEILFSDALWRPCTILAWARHDGGWAVLVRWHSGAQDWHVFDRRFIRAARDLALRRAPTEPRSSWAAFYVSSHALSRYPSAHPRLGQLISDDTRVLFPDWRCQRVVFLTRMTMRIAQARHWSGYCRRFANLAAARKR